MEWWSHLWLNEGFARWVSHMATDILFPEWKIWTQFLDIHTDGLRMDALEHSHQLRWIYTRLVRWSKSLMI
ncbi:Peptidase M1, alanine aminopeptidase/leukotriene A4 hydrolase [Parasponia andersonii]|uniref:Peptidase M1, alanine aminopeptidase/leukotriene A4 hydrolase n=1 Tax=Parasponia andersonii TaxID=3476 RepID=A0A2P5DWJ1_PARAD|nr:Peptidase M1, alanine aminopeptidase/leukotriene A4 hydrolase [Parasponia andersonii]